MATVTGMTAAAMQAIRDGSVVSAAFDSANHLILTKYDGTTVDGGVIGVATTTLAGPVELATNAETQSGSATNLAVTPAGLASLPGYRVQILADNALAESAAPASYPYGTSLMSASTGSGWSLNGGFGTIVTESISSGRTAQIFYENSGGTASTKAWVREYNTAVGGGGWTAWAQMMLMVQLNAANFTQATTKGNYPAGLSRLYYTTATSSSWDFAGLAGEVETYLDATTDFAKQTFTQHLGGSTANPTRWYRTSNAVNGWTAWQKNVVDPGTWFSYTPTWSTSSGLHVPSYGNAVVSAKASKVGRTVNVTFDIAFGSSTVFGAGATTTDNWTLGLPPQWPANVSTPATFVGLADMYRDRSNLGIARIKIQNSTSVSFGILTTFVAAAFDTSSSNGIGGDLDSLSPWTWANGDFFRGAFVYESAS